MAENCVNPDKDSAMALAAWDVRLYLNTHPYDRRALRLYDRLVCASDECNYAMIPDEQCAMTHDSALERLDAAACCKGENMEDFLNACSCEETACTLQWRWVQDPWPWDGRCTATA